MTAQTRHYVITDAHPPRQERIEQPNLPDNTGRWVLPLVFLGLPLLFALMFAFAYTA